MKHLLKIFFILSFCSCNSPKEFEGKINYSISISNSNPNMDTGILEKMYGKQQSLYFKKGFIKWESESGRPLSTYNPVENINFLQFRPDSIYLQNGTTLIEKIISSKTLNEETILGYTCKGFYIESRVIKNFPTLFKDRKRSYFFSSSFPVESKQFKNCNFNNLNKVYSEIKAIPLKIVDEFNGTIITYTAISIEQKSLDMKIFEIDKNLPRRTID